MKNKLTDLNNHLFAQIERLSDEDTKGEDLEKEIDRAKAVALISKNIIDNAKVVLDAQKTFGSSSPGSAPDILGVVNQTPVGIPSK